MAFTNNDFNLLNLVETATAGTGGGGTGSRGPAGPKGETIVGPQGTPFDYHAIPHCVGLRRATQCPRLTSRGVHPKDCPRR